MQQDEGYEGSWYAGTVTGYDPPLVVVRYDELFESNDSDHEDLPEHVASTAEGAAEGDPSQAVDLAVDHPEGLPHLVNPEPLKQMRAAPPTMTSAEHAAWAAALQPGAALDLSFDGGFWDVELVRAACEVQTSGPPLLQLVVRALQFDAEHTVGGEQLRPPHVWDDERREWSARPPPGVHVPITPKAKKRPRAEADAPSEGQGPPREKASHFALGTRRKGRDGRLWEVDTGPGANDVWMPCEEPCGPPHSPVQPSPSHGAAAPTNAVAASSQPAATASVTAPATATASPVPAHATAGAAPVPRPANAAAGPVPAPATAAPVPVVVAAPPAQPVAVPSQPPGAAVTAHSATPAPVADAHPPSAPTSDPACGANGA